MCRLQQKKSIFVSDNTNQAGRIGSLFKILKQVLAKAAKKIATSVIKNPARALEIVANIATAAATRSPEGALSTLHEVLNFYHNGRGLHLPRFT